MTLGIYAINIYDLDLKANTYYISFYAWLRWKGDCDPVTSLEFTNAVENWGLTTVLLTEKPDTLIDGLNADTYVHHYGSDFGEVGNKSASDYSMVKFSFDLHRPFSFFM